MLLTQTAPQISLNSSVARQYWGHVMKRVLFLMKAESCSRFLISQAHLRPEASDCRIVELKLLFPGLQLSTLAQIYTSLLRPVSTIDNLFIYDVQYPPLRRENDIENTENTEWLDLLLSFPAIKNLYVAKRIAPRIALALQEITGGGTTEVLSALENFYLEGFQENHYLRRLGGIRQFVSARRLTGPPVAISAWHRIERKSHRD